MWLNVEQSMLLSLTVVCIVNGAPYAIRIRVVGEVTTICVSAVHNDMTVVSGKMLNNYI